MVWVLRTHTIPKTSSLTEEMSRYFGGNHLREIRGRGSVGFYQAIQKAYEYNGCYLLGKNFNTIMGFRGDFETCGEEKENLYECYLQTTP